MDGRVAHFMHIDNLPNLPSWIIIVSGAISGCPILHRVIYKYILMLTHSFSTTIKPSLTDSLKAHLAS